jgi:hypothetical protein
MKKLRVSAVQSAATQPCNRATPFHQEIASMSKAKQPSAAKSARSKPPIVEATPTRCKCGSTERERYFHTLKRAIAGVTAGGQPYTHVVWRRTRCRACGQVRTDRGRENRREAKRRAA